MPNGQYSGFMPQEYTPELTQAFYKKMARPIKQRGAQMVGKARGEMLARGMEGDPMEGLMTAGARAGTSQELADLYTGMGMQGAGMRREERLGETQRGWQTGERVGGQEWETGERVGGQEWRSAEGEKSRAFNERMARIQHERMQDMAKTAQRRKYQEALWTGGAGLAAGGLMSLF